MRKSDGNDSLINLQREIYSKSEFQEAMNEHGVFQIRDGLLAHAKDESMQVLGSWKVTPDDLQEKTAERLNSTGMDLRRAFIRVYAHI